MGQELWVFKNINLVTQHGMSQGKKMNVNVIYLSSLNKNRRLGRPNLVTCILRPYMSLKFIFKK